jgi:hypothetical protein
LNASCYPIFVANALCFSMKFLNLRIVGKHSHGLSPRVDRWLILYDSQQLCISHFERGNTIFQAGRAHSVLLQSRLLQTQLILPSSKARVREFSEFVFFASAEYPISRPAA